MRSKLTPAALAARDGTHPDTQSTGEATLRKIALKAVKTQPVTELIITNPLKRRAVYAYLYNYTPLLNYLSNRNIRRIGSAAPQSS